MTYKMIIFSLLSYLFLAIAQASPGKKCQSIPDFSSRPPVSVCVDEQYYDFYIMDKHTRYEKEVFHRYFSDLLKSWAIQSEIPLSLFPKYANLWVAVPEIDPYATALRIAIPMDHDAITEIVIFLPLEMKDWSIDTQSVGVQYGAEYPNQYGYAASQILIKRKPNTSMAQLDQEIQRYPANIIEDLGHLWYAIEVPVLSESSIIRQFRKDAKINSIVDYVNMSPIYEWNAWRNKAFSFRLE